MRTILHIIFVCIFFSVAIVACTTVKGNKPSQQAIPSATVTPSPSVTATLLPSATNPPALSSTPLSLPTATLTPTVTDVLEPNETSIVLTPRLIAAIQLDPERNNPLPDDVWWSEDSQKLYFQEIQTEQAWSYDVTTGISNTSPYIPRSFGELAPMVEATLPDNAQLFSLSPSRQYVLYRIPLPEPIPFTGPPVTTKQEYPPYQYELWLRYDGEDTLLGLVDSSFGLLAPPIWSANENVAIVNTAGAPGVPNIYDSWLIDIDDLSVGRLDTPWEGNVYFYSVRDLSADGNLLLVRADINYFFNRETGEQWPIPGVDTDRIILIGTEESPGCLVSELEFSDTILRSHIWYCQPVKGKSHIIATIKGQTSQNVISPDNKFIAFTVSNQFAGVGYKDISPSIWLVPLP